MDENNKPMLLLVDGSSYLYRAYHALPNLTGPGGFPTGAIHGFIAMLKKLRSDVNAEHAVCVFDAKGKTFRDDWYAEYKANRSPMPEDLVKQIEPIHEAVKLLGWPVLEVPGIEADDAIGTLAQRAAASGHRVLVSTGDKDLAQLVNADVTLINTMSGETLDIEGVKTKFGVPPDRIVDYLTLVGDSVDNVPGVDKVGPKTAAKWIAEHGSLDAVIANADAIGGAVGANLKKALDWLPMGRKLVTVATDCDLSAQVAGWPSLDALALREVDRTALIEFYSRYGFKAFKRELEESDAASDEPVAAPRVPPPTPQQRQLRNHPHPGPPRPLVSEAPVRAARRLRHRDHLARRNGRAHRRRLVFRRAGRGRLRAADARLPGRTASASDRRRAGAARNRGSKTRERTRSASTSSTTCMCSPTTVSPRAASCTTRCSKAMCSKRT